MKVKVLMARAYDCKHSVRYNADPAEAHPVLQSVYVLREVLPNGQAPDVIAVTVDFEPTANDE